MRRPSRRKIESAQLNLSFCYIISPFDGRIGLRNVDPGNVVQPAEATPIISATQIRPITLVTGDALHCQGETARLVKERGGDWLFTLKADRPVQHAEVRAWFADPASRADDEHTTTDADNGRIEVRRHALSHDMSWMLSDQRHADEASRHARYGGSKRDPRR